MIRVPCQKCVVMVIFWIRAHNYNFLMMCSSDKTIKNYSAWCKTVFPIESTGSIAIQSLCEADSHSVKKFSIPYRSSMFIVVFTRCHYWILHRAASQSISLRSIFVSSSHLCLQVFRLEFYVHFLLLPHVLCALPIIQICHILEMVQYINNIRSTARIMLQTLC